MKKLVSFLCLIVLLFNWQCTRTTKKSEDFEKDFASFIIPQFPSLVPEVAGSTPNYWCTWGSQNYAIDSTTVAKAVFGIEGHSVIAANLTEENVFGKKGWAQCFDKVRKDLFILFDVGWDVPSGENFDNSRWKLGSQNLASDKFPSCTGTPAEKLRKLNELCLAQGWKGAAIWIPAHAWLDGKEGKSFSKQQLKDFFIEKAVWSKEAGIRYWKMDYGSRGEDLEFRKMVTHIALKYSPGLIVEHARGGGPLNDLECPWDCAAGNSGEFSKWCQGKALQSSAEISNFSQVFRTYDVTPYLSIPTTLDRGAQILSKTSGQPDNQCLLNIEDEPYMAAALNCMMGIMRNPKWIEVSGFKYDPLQLSRRSTEVVRAIRWQRLAPAVPAGTGTLFQSETRLTDSWNVKKGDSWITWLFGKEVKQSAPAIVSRNMPLPEVRCEGDFPYVVSSLHPSGYVSIASFRRHDKEKGFHYPHADIRIKIEGDTSILAVFGEVNSLTVQRTGKNKKMQVIAQDLAGNIAFNITPYLQITSREIRIDGEILKILGKSANPEGDISDPAVMVKIIP